MINNEFHKYAKFYDKNKKPRRDPTNSTRAPDQMTWCCATVRVQS